MKEVIEQLMTLKIMELQKPLKIITEHFWNSKQGIFDIGKSHFPIPCLNENMIYLLSYFQYDSDEYIQKVVNFFEEYQSCYGQHTCYWGVVKLLKGLSFVPQEKRTEKTQILIKKCIDFILLHEVCYSSIISRNLFRII